jgi:predicted permease
LFAYPLIESVWGKEGLKYISMFDMGNSVIVFGVCYVTASIFSMEGGKVDFRGVLKRAASSIPFMSYIVTLIFNLSGLHFPKLMIDITGILSKANMPLSLLLLGIYLSFSFEKEHLVKMMKILGLRYGIGTAVGIILYLVLPVEPLFKNIMLLAFTLPISMSVIPYSVQFDYDKKFVGTINNMTIIMSFLYVWAVVAFVLS